MHQFIEKFFGFDKEKKAIIQGLLDGSIVVNYKCKNNMKATYNINFGGKKIKIYEKINTYMGEWSSSDYLLNNETNLKDLGEDGRYLMKIINEFDKQRITQRKEEINKKINVLKKDISEILSLSDPIIEYQSDGNKQIYNINFGGKEFKVYAIFNSYMAELSFDKFLLNNETNLKDLGKEGKYLIKVINEFNKKELNNKKKEKDKTIDGSKKNIIEVLGDKH